MESNIKIAIGLGIGVLIGIVIGKKLSKTTISDTKGGAIKSTLTQAQADVMASRIAEIVNTLMVAKMPSEAAAKLREEARGLGEQLTNAGYKIDSVTKKAVQMIQNKAHIPMKP
jgi:hypothetical protein